MQLITDDYKKLNKELHERNKYYGTSGGSYLEDVIKIIRHLKTQDVLDYGCGKSRLAMNLPFSIHQYDPAIEKHAALPKAADIVVCTDVLEHVEPQFMDDIVAHIASLTKKMGYLAISTASSKKTLADGRNSHLTVKPARWWISKILEHFEMASFTKFDLGCTFMVERKENK